MKINLEFEEIRSIWATENKMYDAWLTIDGKAIAYAHLLETPEYNGEVCVCDIETREGYRQQGYATLIMSMIHEKLGQPLAMSGGFTPEGFTAFNGKVPILYGHTAPTKANFRSMTFIHDWEARQAKR